MTELRAYLTQAQDEDRRAGRLVFMEAPTRTCGWCDGRGACPNCDSGRVPISDTVPCPECEAAGEWCNYGEGGDPRCAEPPMGETVGRVPRVVEVVRPAQPCHHWDDHTDAVCYPCEGTTVLPRAIVARAQVEALRVHGDPDTFDDPDDHLSVDRDGVVRWQSGNFGYVVTYAFPDGPPEPGTVLWRLHGWEAVEEQTTVPCPVDAPDCAYHSLPDLPPGHIYAEEQ